MRFPRVIRLDDSDNRVYENTAVPGEWAVPGSFVFMNVDPDTLEGKKKQAFLHGFLGTESFGWATLVSIAEISEPEYQLVIENLATHFMHFSSYPDRSAAIKAAREEAEFAASLCEHDAHTLLALERKVEDESIVENFRIVRLPDASDHAAMKLWTVDDS